MANINLLKPKLKRLAEIFIKECKKKGITVVITQTLRTIDRQNKLYAQGRSIPGKIVTNAKGGQSYHNFGVAFDFAIMEKGRIDWDIRNKKWGEAEKIGQSLGLEWGGAWASFPDLPHFQLTLGYTLSQFQKNQVDNSRYS